MKLVLQFGLRQYKRWISPLLPHSCRFVPTCSEYAMEAIERHGAMRGSWLAFRRLLRCHPFAGSGYDPVPRMVEGHGFSRAENAPGAVGFSPGAMAKANLEEHVFVGLKPDAST